MKINIVGGGPAGLYFAILMKNNTSTFIVECVGDSWTNAGFEKMSDDQTCDYLATLFKKDLGGHPLMHNDFAKWLNFVVVKNRNWFHENVVLLGDAAHTAHFSIGSGTKLALETAIALALRFRETGDVGEPLAEFQKSRTSTWLSREGAILARLRVRARIDAHSWASRRPSGKAREVNNI